VWSDDGPLRYERLTWPEVRRAAAFYLASPAAFEVIGRVRESTRGGMAHACELETSIYLAIDPDAVAMDLAVDERSYPEGEHACRAPAAGRRPRGRAQPRHRALNR
jgi:creatinine amidohydrolase/Fe(II)-dependent formamide hydrolase-like protein